MIKKHKKFFLFLLTIIILVTSSKCFKNVLHRNLKKKLQKNILNQEVMVKCKNESFYGIEMETFTGIKYYSFLGIPFASPPIEELRFKPPEPFNFTQRRWNARFERSPCLQFHLESKKWNTKRLIFNNLALGKEDCLYLNVYTPRLPKNYFNEKLLPVMVWIHGGGFLIGGGEQSRYNPDHFINENVIMISLNYRLGAFGFLTTGNKKAPGNNGLRDQVMALKWINERVKSFGGDPKKVTIFGQSAGAASISYLIQAEHAKGLFCRAIMQSGTSLCPWALSRDVCPKEKYKRFKKLSSKKILETSMKETIQTLALRNPLNGFSYAPVAENNHSDSLFYGKSHEKLKNCDIINQVPILLGINAREEDTIATKMHFLEKISFFLFTIKLRFNRIIKDVVPIDMNLDENKCNKDQISYLIKNHYNITKKGFTPNLMRFIGDNIFVKPIMEFAKLYSHCNKGKNTFLYEFVYDSHGVGHGDELPYFFKPNKNDSVYFISKRLIKMWTNFAKTGNPTPFKDPLLQNIRWPSTSEYNNFAYLEIGNDLSIQNNSRTYDLTFWNDLYEKCGTPPFDTY
nr:carboxylesterase 5A-like isoform X1 [Onthophagus taurus]XP_022919916.1 carboxylesterase 5A-like isoform X1 [Onthophagus taurus]